MGMTRKFMSIMSLGLVDFRSDKERTAGYTKQLRDDQRKALKEQQQERDKKKR